MRNTPGERAGALHCIHWSIPSHTQWEMSLARCWDICSRCESLEFKLLLQLRQSLLTAIFLGLKARTFRGKTEKSHHWGCWKSKHPAGKYPVSEPRTDCTAEPEDVRDLALTLLWIKNGKDRAWQEGVSTVIGYQPAQGARSSLFSMSTQRQVDWASAGGYCMCLTAGRLWKSIQMPPSIKEDEAKAARRGKPSKLHLFVSFSWVTITFTAEEPFTAGTEQQASGSVESHEI